jgi:signal transduction histidine kinase
MTRSNVRKKVLIPLTLTFLVLFSAFLYSGYAIREEKIERDLANRYNVAQSTFREVIEQRVELMTTIGEILAHDELSRAAMRKGDRTALYRQAAPIFTHMSENGGISHLYYHTSEAINFLRVYRPEKFGDQVTRTTLIQALKTGKPTHALELGDLGTLTLRVVIPWRDENSLFGFIELGTEIDTILAGLRKIGGFDYVVTIEKEFLERAKWEKGMERLHRPAAWDDFPTKVVIDSSISMSTANLISTFNLDKDPTKAEWKKIVGNDGRHFASRQFTLHTACGRTVGNYFLFYDTTNEITSFYTFIIRVVGIGLLLSGAIFIFAWRILGKTDCELDETTQKLLKEMAGTEQSNVALAAEVHQRRQVEEELHLVNDQLEERVKERTSRLAEANREIESRRVELATAYADLQAKQATILHQDKMACIGQLAAGVAHDINNPVGFISHNLKILARYLHQIKQFVNLQETLIKTRSDADLFGAWMKGRSDFKIDQVFQDLPDMLDECHDGTARISQIVQGLRTFSRNDAPQRQKADLNQCLDNTLTMLRHELHDKIKVVRDYGEIPLRCCYPAELSQVFMNLLFNAIQAIDSKGEIRIRTWAENRQINVSISDSGCGIPAEQLEKIFEPFFTTKPVGVGTGLGLSIVYDIITRHQGEIQVDSVPGQGTTFTLLLPCDESATTRALHDETCNTEEREALDRS